MATVDLVDIGTSADDGAGDPLRTAFGKINDSVQALNAELAGKAQAAHVHDTDTLANGAVTYVKMQPMAAGSRLLGCGTDGSGVVREITLGTNLSMSGNTLNASGSGAGSADWGTIGGDIADQTDLQDALADGTTHTHTTAAITSGTFADARIAASNVTQHQAALSITVSQISDAGALAALDQVDTAQIATGAVGPDQLAADAIDSGTLIADDVIDSEHIAAGALDAEHYAADSVGPAALAHTAVTPDTYTLATVTVDQQGRITAASSGTGTDASGSRVPTVGGALAVTHTDHEATKGVTLITDQANAVFTIENSTPAGKVFKFGPLHDGATAVIEGGTGSIDGVAGGTMRQINGGPSFLEVISNAGTAPVCVTYGDVIHAPAEVNGTKTYDVNDSNQEFVLVSGAGTQTMPAVAGMPPGWEVAIYNESGGNITIDGADADVTLADNDFCVIKKPHTSMLAFGSFSTGKSVLDAA